MAKTHYHSIITGDGTPSIYMDEYNEAMHSVSGAYEESLLKHVYPSRILEPGKERVTLLDIGFGLGYTILALVYQLSKSDIDAKVDIISLEKELIISRDISRYRFNDERDILYRDIMLCAETGSLYKKNFSLKIMAGDARESIQGLKDESFDAVFHDPFSPAKNPELWSVDFFRMLYRVMKTNAILTTYSSAPQVRGAMFEAGFSLAKGPSVGGKREGTLAAKEQKSHPSEALISASCLREIKNTPYRDKDLNDARNSILTRRIEEMALKREKLKKGR